MLTDPNKAVYIHERGRNRARTADHSKASSLLVPFALVLFVAHASITTVTVDEEDTWRPSRRSQSSCQEQIREQDHLKDTQKYMEEECGCSSSSRGNRQCSRHLDSCCWQLGKLDNQCRYPGLKHAAMQQMKGQMGREEMQELYEAAEKIMSKCDMQPRSGIGLGETLDM
ncbi:2S sulfur-rich seed storage protein 2-like [Hibiscus syriacus]|uniref:2S sulfur-rich seed storage protein 2-like n=1 Tax=Hibiscus syriacus TaxID=106335 RepID=UPI0019220F9C|nr:2S sulfur-rich seed storage protein 2-like [Hibiscus syriacus]